MTEHKRELVEATFTTGGVTLIMFVGRTVFGMTYRRGQLVAQR
jgi:hypothetical protein